MEDDDDVDITIEDIKPSRSKSGFYGKMPDQSNNIRNIKYPYKNKFINFI